MAIEAFDELLTIKTDDPKTNGDAIRQMDDETLASFLLYGVHEDSEEGAKIINGEEYLHDYDEMVDWLGKDER